MSRNKFAVVSDLHLGVHQNSEKWLKEALKFAEWFREECFNQSIYDIIVPGDFFHDRTDINLLTIQYATKILEVWKDFHIWMIPGNHDCFYKDNATVSSVSIFKGYKNVTLFEKTDTLIQDGKHITFVPWGVALADIPKSDVIVGHFELNGFKMNSYKVCEGHDDSENLLDKAPLTITGHFHTKQEKFGRKGRVVYVGTPYQMDYNDLGVEKGYHILDVKTLDLLFIEYKHTTKHKKLTLSQLVDNKANLSDYLEKEVRNNVITFVIDKDIEFEKINALVQKIQLFEPLAYRGTEFLKKEETGVETQNIQVNVQVEQLIGEFIKKMELENSDAVLKLVIEYYTKYKAV